MAKKYTIDQQQDWNFEDIKLITEMVEKIGTKELGLDLYQNQIEIISSEQMIDMYTSIGMPVYYKHWSFGKSWIEQNKSYKSGRSGLALELVVNTSPTINYLMSENSLISQALVLAHAAVGHNTVFRNNYLFKEWTDAENIIDYLVFAKNYVEEQERIHGQEVVEKWLDSCHALSDYGINRYKRPGAVSIVKERERQTERAEYLQSQVSEMYRLLPTKENKSLNTAWPKQPEENILYFCEKYAPNLAVWQRELIRITRKIATYFAPQGQCVTGNHIISTPTGLLRFDEYIQDAGYNQVQNNLELLTLGNKFTPISYTYKKLQQEVYRVTTASGKTITGTAEHPINILSNGEFDINLKKIKDINISDHLAINLDYDIFSKKEPDIIYHIDNSKLECDECGMISNTLASHIVQSHTTDRVTSVNHIRGKSKNQFTKIPLTMNSDLAELIALLQSTKISRNYAGFNFNSRYEIILDRYVQLLDNLFGIKIKSKNNSIRFTCLDLKEFLNQIVPDLNNTVPKIVRMSTKNSIKHYIKMFVDSHRGFKKNSTVGNFKIPGYPSNVEFFQQLQTLLYGFGIVSNITTSNRNTWAYLEQLFEFDLTCTSRTNIDVKYFGILYDWQKIYENKIGTLIPNLTSSSVLTTSHVLPGARPLYDGIKNRFLEKKQKYSDSLDLRHISHYVKLRDNLLIKNNFDKILFPYMPNKDKLKVSHINKYAVTCFDNIFNVTNDPAAKILENFISISKNIYYDEIIKIEKLDELEDVYDVTVPENHLFWLDGFISHNTKTLNEGMATYTHYNIMNLLKERDITTDGAHLEYLALHSSVIYQPSFNSKYYSGMNPYKLGFEILSDVERMCKNPTEEDLQWFPMLKGENHWDVIKDIVANYRDESFIRQWLSPKLIRDFGFFAVKDTRTAKHYDVTNIHNNQGYETIRSTLANTYERDSYIPQIEVVKVDPMTKKLYLQYTPYMGRELNHSDALMNHLKKLWGGYEVYIGDVNGNKLNSA
jgi:spore cortex formation protein SpoVR/YcgB (stage V sporulation)/intein/homing endonuclease